MIAQTGAGRGAIGFSMGHMIGFSKGCAIETSGERSGRPCGYMVARLSKWLRWQQVSTTMDSRRNLGFDQKHFLNNLT